jgi:hypothetical protein
MEKNILITLPVIPRWKIHQEKNEAGVDEKYRRGKL